MSHIDLTVPFHTRIDVEEEGPRIESGTVTVDPRSDGPPLHRHVDQDERWVVVGGALSARIDTRRCVLQAGETLVIPRGTPHTYWNAHDAPCVFQYELTPGHRFTAMMRTFEGLAADGRLRGTQDPRSVLHMAQVFQLFRDHVEAVMPPPWLLRAFAAIGRALGVVRPFPPADAAPRGR